MRSTVSAASPGRVLALLAIALLGVLTAPPAPARVEPASGVWISLGADAFSTLSAAGDLRFAGEPLRVFADSSGVVVTRVDRRDLERIGARIDAAYGRCAGFVAHASLPEALDALVAVEHLRTAAQEAPAFTVDQGPVVQRLQTAISEPPMHASILALSTGFNNRYCLHPSGVAAALWIRDLWQDYAQDRPDVSVELYEHASWPQPSVILTIPGLDLPDELVILGGHLDSTAPGESDPDFLAPGADDNASGIAVLSEVVRVALSEDFRPRRTVQVMAYAAEEIGLGGSLEIASAYKEGGIDVVAVLQLDMTDYFGSTEDVALIDDFVDPALTAFLGQLLDTYQPHLLWTTTLCGYPCSDHASWIINSYDAAFPFESRFHDHNPWIHTTEDTLARLGDSVAHAAKFARLAAAFMVEVAKSADGLFSDGFETGTTERWTTVVQ